MVTFEPQSAAQDISVWGVKVLSSHNMTPDAEHCISTAWYFLCIAVQWQCNDKMQSICKCTH